MASNRHGRNAPVGLAGAITCARQPTPAYASLLRLRSVKGRCAQASPGPCPPATALPFGKLPEGSWPTRFVSQFVKGLDNFLLIEGILVLFRARRMSSSKENLKIQRERRS